MTNKKPNLDYNVPNRRKGDFLKPVKNFTDSARQISDRERAESEKRISDMVNQTRKELE